MFIVADLVSLMMSQFCTFIYSSYTVLYSLTLDNAYAPSQLMYISPILLFTFSSFVIHEFNANAHHCSLENAINSAQEFYRVQKLCASIERQYIWQLPVCIYLPYVCIISVVTCSPRAECIKSFC